MEKTIFKAGIYGFIMGVLLCVAFYPDRHVSRIGNAAEVTYVPLRDYIFDVLRFSAKIALVSVLVAALVGFYRKLPDRKTSASEFTAGLIISFIVCFALFMAVFLLAGWIFH